MTAVGPPDWAIIPFPNNFIVPYPFRIYCKYMIGHHFTNTVIHTIIHITGLIAPCKVGLYGNGGAYFPGNEKRLYKLTHGEN